MRRIVTTIALLPSLLAALGAHAADQPQWGQAWTRNMVSGEKNLPDDFEPGRPDGNGGIDMATTRNVRWTAQLGSGTHGSPIVAAGKVLVGTNNGQPRDPRHQGDRGVLMCFDEATGKFLWQLVVPKLVKVKFGDWHYVGLTSPPTVENGLAYLVTNRCEVICLDLDGMADGNDGPYQDEGRHMAPAGREAFEATATDADIVWVYDMVEHLGVSPHNASNCSVLLHGNHLYVCTSNGVEWTHEYVANPEAPSLIALDKRNGRLLARDDFGIGEDIIHGQWSSPALARVGGKECVFFGAGNGYLYACQALSAEFAPGDKPALLKNVWKFNGHPLAQTQNDVPIEHGHETESYEVTAMPVFGNDRVFVAFTQEAYHNRRLGWFACLRTDGADDVTRKSLAWSFTDCGASVSTAAVADGLVYLADFAGGLYCLDAQSGEPQWTHHAGGPIWGSPLVADGKVYLCTGRAHVLIVQAGRQFKLIRQIRMRDRILATPTAANGTLFVPTMSRLYAIANDDQNGR